MIIKYALLTFIALLTGCATTPKFDTKNIDLALTPQQAVREIDATRGKLVLWGGTILDIKNLKDETQIEILAYPLNTNHRPLTDRQPLGRFIILQSGYLETTTYMQGKQLSVLGKVSGTRSGKVGETLYTYTLVKAQQLHLWSENGDTRTFFHFGIGIHL